MKKENKQVKRSIIQLTLGVEDHEKLSKRAEKETRSLSNMVSVIVRGALKTTNNAKV